GQGPQGPPTEPVAPGLQLDPPRMEVSQQLPGGHSSPQSPSPERLFSPCCASPPVSNRPTRPPPGASACFSPFVRTVSADGFSPVPPDRPHEPSAFSGGSPSPLAPADGSDGRAHDRTPARRCKT